MSETRDALVSQKWEKQAGWMWSHAAVCLVLTDSATKYWSWIWTPTQTLDSLWKLQFTAICICNLSRIVIRIPSVLWYSTQHRGCQLSLGGGEFIPWTDYQFTIIHTIHNHIHIELAKKQHVSFMCTWREPSERWESGISLIFSNCSRKPNFNPFLTGGRDNGQFVRLMGSSPQTQR